MEAGLVIVLGVVAVLLLLSVVPTLLDIGIFILDRIKRSGL